MTDADKIKMLQERCDSLCKENARLRKAQQEVHSLRRVLPKDKVYIHYLLITNASLERCVEEQQHVLAQYQKHYAKFGRFYTEWELSTGTHNNQIEL